jgi:hypothetical protein
MILLGRKVLDKAQQLSRSLAPQDSPDGPILLLEQNTFGEVFLITLLIFM